MYVQSVHTRPSPGGNAEFVEIQSLWRRTRDRLRFVRIAVALGTTALLTSCDAILLSNRSENTPTTLPLSAVDLEEETGGDDTLKHDLSLQAESLSLGQETRSVVGTISGARDVDVYDLGPIEPGDHIVATMTTDATLDGALGLFDESGTALLVDDHRNVYLGRAEPLIDVVARRASSACYLAVSATPGYAGHGEYALTLSKRTLLTIPPPQPDTILLVFSGGRDVRIGNRPSVDVPPFESEGISGTFAGRTDSMTAEIVARVRKDYQGFHVEILSTSEGDAFEPGMSRVFFGTYDDGLLGIAQGVDEFNSIKGQSAVVFTDTFEAFMVLHPTATEMSQALANVASHEIGHLLGLVHTSDPAGIMDVTASLVELTRDQQFRLSPIYEEVFPLGFQDEVRSLLDNVGGDFEIVAAAKPHSGRDPVRSRERLDEAARARWPLSSCGLCAVETP